MVVVTVDEIKYYVVGAPADKNVSLGGERKAACIKLLIGRRGGKNRILP